MVPNINQRENQESKEIHTRTFLTGLNLLSLYLTIPKRLKFRKQE